MAAQRSSIAVGVARASLTVATAFALTRVFAGRSWMLVMIVAAVAPPVFLGWAQRRHWHALVRFAVVVVGGVWLSALVADPKTTVLGIPTRATMVSLGEALSDAPHTLRSAIVPVEPVGSALVLALIGVFVAAVLTAWIATSLDAPIGAFAPSIALFIVVGAMGGGSWVLPTTLYALAALGYLLALAQDDLVARRTWFHAARPRVSRIAAGGAALGAIAIVLALAVGPSVPGASGNPLVDYKGGLGSSDGSLLSAPPPILRIQDKLRQRTTQELFTVKAERAAYWRVIALDWFSEDNAWGVNKATQRSASSLSPPDDPPTSQRLHQQFDIEEIDPHWLPAAYLPVQINLSAARVVPESHTLLVDSSQPIGKVVYDVESLIPTPSVADLRAAPLDPNSMREQLELPSKFPESVRELARDITAGADGPYDRSVALLQFFRKDGNFTYTTDTNLEDSINSIEQFLFTEKAGFCEQFAASFAAMARAVGVPSRVAVGYQPGEFRADTGRFHVTNRNAHAWPEVWIAGAGWIPFEPTPAFDEPTLGLGTGGPRPVAPASTTSTTTGSRPTSSLTLPTVQPTLPDGSLDVQPIAEPPGERSVVGTIVTFALITLAAVAFVGLVILASFAFSIWRKSYRRRNAGDLRERVLGAWAEALDVLFAAGVPPRPSATALEFALRHAPAHGAGEAGPALMELARLQSAAMFSPDPPTTGEATAAWEQVDVIRASSKRTITRTARWRRQFRAR